MAKRAVPNIEGFGRRIAERRRAAGYTQQQLADLVGVSRRMIAYYEGESGHPPASFLADLARALETSADDLLGNPLVKNVSARASISSRWERRVRQIERLGRKPRQQIATFIDAILAEHGSQGGKS